MVTERRWRVVPLTTEYTRGLAECHIACWRDAYRDLVPAHILAAFDVGKLTVTWEHRLRRYPENTVVAVLDDTVIGFASGGHSLDEPPVTAKQLYAMYVRTAWYGTGVAHDLMRATLDPRVDTSLWVFEENPRAQTFYRKYGFELDGTRRVEAFTPAVEVRMIRRAELTSRR
ncbi:GNAT family N-acetyltransferase [Nocardia sp. CDC159]|uniref:GNAT family N-acetyltransferase n=1 Tax=Nocardia pulmonis TaxID=2951408 RepID=A0A9X2E538_9NOCA|nr:MULTISPECIES: GNAT family N-acetyltransferase [Nocardia]MCM6773796.1 GNAT family N-acetyltransferase [Nocardia pulmonis]MCM6786683.1 GNAT family N-acetyltransferase [Nocardia sp. CDC159]